MSFSINYLIFCVPTLHINDYRNRDIVLNALIAELITLGVKHHMSGKVPKSKDFYKVPLCSNTIVSTWKEVREYIDGKLKLPDKSIVLCFDDGAKSFLDHGIPVLEKCKVPATCFMITSSNGEEKIAQYQSDYVYYESHSHNMHRPGGNIGHGGIFPAISHEEGMADLKKSIEICGSGDAFAYPYGDYNDSSVAMVKEAGFLCAVTTQPGKAKPGDNPLLLPRVRMSLGQSLEAFQKKVQP